jgi:hypothetical protein
MAGATPTPEACNNQKSEEAQKINFFFEKRELNYLT